MLIRTLYNKLLLDRANHKHELARYFFQAKKIRLALPRAFSALFKSSSFFSALLKTAEILFRACSVSSQFIWIKWI
jgi:hypothetical protein